jgi:hypothetical protein
LCNLQILEKQGVIDYAKVRTLGYVRTGAFKRQLGAHVFNFLGTTAKEAQAA